MNQATINKFEQLASDTWARLLYSFKLGCTQSETTITDINLLDLIRANLSNIKILKASIEEEKKYGFDWECWIGSNTSGWFRYSVQAKRLYTSGKYKSLRHEVKKIKKFQIDLLENFAKKHQTILLYCFYNYNHTSIRNVNSFWQCCVNFDAPQLGCTLSPLQDVRKVWKKGVSKTFEKIHESQNAIPWRCLVKCPSIINVSNPNTHPLAPKNFSIQKIDTLPIFLQSGIENFSIVDLPREFYDFELGIYPKWIIIVDLDIDSDYFIED